MFIPWGLPAQELEICEDGCICLWASFPPVVQFVTGFAKQKEKYSRIVRVKECATNK